MSAADQNVIMLLGDSITQGGWEAGGFAQQLALRAQIGRDQQLSGYNTEWAVPVFEKCFAKQHEQQHLPKVRILTIWSGTNDAAIPPSAQHVPLAAFAAKLVRMVRIITSPLSAHYSPSTRIVLITPPPVNSYMRCIRPSFVL
ncbi:hypothetical protein FIBSPDRAFT_968657 [Athelia psychrophila]|uniref:SGNH hydrolase-type esterase domain-containing protein n=1 Tax=Athelia psychrophila TaxID=1759441 RepID=A0A167UDA4_9AGAM|nr:hypothetical protein FIBSPDRAFT_968657 [Fibularhizoctonia sp. CBS 109695]